MTSSPSLNSAMMSFPSPGRKSNRAPSIPLISANYILSRAATDGIVPFSVKQATVPSIAVNEIIYGVFKQNFITFISKNSIATYVSHKKVSFSISLDRVVIFSGKDGVVAVSSREGIVSDIAKQDVISGISVGTVCP